MGDPHAEIGALNARIVDSLRGRPNLWDVPVDEVRRAREEGRSVFGELVHSPRARQETLETAGGPIGVRVISPDQAPIGVYVHFHGGGWVLGAPHHQDPRLVRLADATRQVVVSVDYRLAPEHPYPSGPDDCEQATLTLLDSATERFGAPVTSLGGESAGAHLALVTALRMRDRHGYTGFKALNLVYGVFDLRLTPSARSYGPGPQVLTTDGIRWFVRQFAPGADLDDPDVSPLLADLRQLPPAVFTVGTNDPLLDDTLFLAARWEAAGCTADLEVTPAAPHAFDAFDVEAGRAALDRINRFLSAAVAT
ncbi:MAG: alpha/beta hydrolase [Acidimicrobiia bacterium]|nr:alpha/beta hydrolase [Acidimicrobiia bacterium]